MNYSLDYLILTFFIYGFLAWMAELCYCSLLKRKIVRRGMLHLPLVLSDGVAILIAIFALERLKGNIFWLFLGSMIYGALIQSLAGFVIERLTGRPDWDYSKQKFHLGQYTSLINAAYYGITGVVILYLIQPILIRLINKISPIYLHRVVILMLAILVVDILWVSIQRWNASPHTVEKVFAQGYNIYKLIWIFFLASFLGDITETIFCRLTAGVWMSRSSVLYGPFSIVWGLGGVFLTITLHNLTSRSDRYIFIFGTVLGGAYEYLCSVVTEALFGTVFWDYSKLPFNLGGRINLLFCFFWGFAALIWLKELYPRLSGVIEKIPVTLGKPLTWMLLVLMIADISLSAAALDRASERKDGTAAANSLEEYLDLHYPDEWIANRYPNMKFVEGSK